MFRIRVFVDNSFIKTEFLTGEQLCGRAKEALANGISESYEIEDKVGNTTERWSAAFIAENYRVFAYLGVSVGDSRNSIQDEC